MIHRGEHAEIITFVGDTVDSELSGNMIDICPVGALTSKPFRYSARTWELSRRKSVSPHDSTGRQPDRPGQEPQGHARGAARNESSTNAGSPTATSPSARALNSDDRLTQPMLKQGVSGVVDWRRRWSTWPTASGVKGRTRWRAAIGALATQHSTGRAATCWGSWCVAWATIDHRCAMPISPRWRGARWLGLPIAELVQAGPPLRGRLVGPRRTIPLFASRLRQAAVQARRQGVRSAGQRRLAMPVRRTHRGPSAWARPWSGRGRRIAPKMASLRQWHGHRRRGPLRRSLLSVRTSARRCCWAMRRHATPASPAGPGPVDRREDRCHAGAT